MFQSLFRDDGLCLELPTPLEVQSTRATTKLPTVEAAVTMLTHGLCGLCFGCYSGRQLATWWPSCQRHGLSELLVGNS